MLIPMETQGAEKSFQSRKIIRELFLKKDRTKTRIFNITTLNTQLRNRDSSLFHIDVGVFVFFSSPFFISFSWNHVLVCLWSYVFRLRSFNKTGVGCNNCVQPHSQNEHLINPPLSPVLATRLSAL